jgi:hypothetical protein
MIRRIAALGTAGTLIASALVIAPTAQAAESQGRWFYFTNETQGGPADFAFAYGRSTDVALVGDWDGDGVDTLGVRRGNQYFLTNSTTAGPAEITFAYGKASDAVLVGDWDGNRTDTLGVRRGNQYHLTNGTTGGAADIVFAYGKASDAVLVGDWDGNRTTTLAVRRHTGPASIPAVSYAQEPVVLTVGTDVPSGLYEASTTTADCRWYRVDGSGNELGWGTGGGRAYLEVAPDDRKIEIYSGCGIWRTAFPADTPKIVSNPTDGQYRVGVDVSAGRYIATTPGSTGPASSCYVAVLRDFRGQKESVEANYSTEERGQSLLLDLYESDTGLETSGCGTWTRVGDSETSTSGGDDTVVVRTATVEGGPPQD